MPEHAVKKGHLLSHAIQFFAFTITKNRIFVNIFQRILEKSFVSKKCEKWFWCIENIPAKASLGSWINTLYTQQTTRSSPNQPQEDLIINASRSNLHGIMPIEKFVVSRLENHLNYFLCCASLCLLCLLSPVVARKCTCSCPKYDGFHDTLLWTDAT